MTVNTLQIVLLATGPGNGKSKLEENRQSAKGDDAADNPKEQRYTN